MRRFHVFCLVAAVPYGDSVLTAQELAPLSFFSSVATNEQPLVPDANRLRSRTASVAVTAQDILRLGLGGLLRFNLFGNTTFDGVIDRLEQPPSGYLVLSGHLLRKAAGTFTLVLKDGVVAGEVRTAKDGLFEIRYRADGLHTIREIDPSRFPPCGTKPEDDKIVPPQMRRVLPAGGGCPDDGSVIDMMVAYTPTARDASGSVAGIESRIMLAAEATNTAYLNSGIVTRINVVLMHQVDYVESGDSATDRARISDPNDGFMDEVPLLRDEVAADVVSLVVGLLENCGRAFFSITTGNVPVPELGYNVVLSSCAVGNLTFAHELGHNQGSRHDRGADPSNGGAFEYSHGFIEPGGQFRTVMGVSTPGVPRIQYFSNPNVSFMGIPTGLPPGNFASADNALSIDNTSFNVANFRQSRDCNGNGVCDDQDIASGTSPDCNANGRPDDCEPDCNANGVTDECDIASGTSTDCNANGIPDDCINLEVDCNGNLVPDICDINDATSIDCSSNGIPDECEPDCNGNTTADSCDIFEGTSTDDNGNGVPDDCEPTVVFVDASATGSNTGVSWANAFTNLQDALALADAALGRVTEIWVADGTYRPAPGTTGPTTTFQLIRGTAIYGGFAGGEASRDQRDPAVHETILDGDNLLNDGTVIPPTGSICCNSTGTLGCNDAACVAAVCDRASSCCQNWDSNCGWWAQQLCCELCSPDLDKCDNSRSVVTSNGTDTTAILDGFTITRGHAPYPNVQGHGAGLINMDGSPMVRNCLFRNNMASSGGGVFSVQGHPWLVHCTFENNGNGIGAGVLIGTTFTSNIATSNATITGCAFLNNVGSGSGGTLVAGGRNGNLTITNCTFSGNTADKARSIKVSHLGWTTIQNCIMANDPAAVESEMEVFDNPDTRLHFAYNAIRGGQSFVVVGSQANLVWGAGNTGADPLLSPDGLQPGPGSPAINGGDPNFVADWIKTDITGAERIQQCRVDMGALESALPAADCNANGQPDACDIANGTGIDVDLNGVPDACETHTLIFVDSTNCPGPGTGTQIDPFCDIQTAIDAAGTGTTQSIEIIVADGTYTGPGNIDLDFGGRAVTLRSANGPNNCIIDAGGAGRAFFFHSGESETTIVDGFTLTNGTATQGGAVFCQASSPTIRNCKIIGNTASLGGGIYVENAVPTFRDCRIEGNTAMASGGESGLGGGVYGVDAAPRFQSCQFVANVAQTTAGPDSLGGGMYFITSDPWIRDCRFTDNLAGGGGGLYLEDSRGTIHGCTFLANTANAENGFAGGGAVYTRISNPFLSNCSFLGNKARTIGVGGGMLNVDSNPLLVNCIFSGNATFGPFEFSRPGGAMYNVSNSSLYDGNPVLIGCTISNNHAISAGGGIRNVGVQGSDPVLRNCILWGNTVPPTFSDAQISNCAVCEPDIRHSDIQGLTVEIGGIGNIGDDPLFLNAMGIDGIAGTEDDDFRLAAGSPCVDSGNKGAVPAMITTDLAGNSRFLDDIDAPDAGFGVAPLVDMGALERDADCNGNGIPDATDIANGTSRDCTQNSIPDECEPDCNSNAIADTCDIAAGVATDCNANTVPDSCDLANALSGDCDGNTVPDECQPDSDGDRIINPCDGCPSDGTKTEPGVCGCGAPDIDSDSDTVLDCLDTCPGFDDRADMDGDGVPDGCDICAGFDDRLDSDADTVPDGCDGCPFETTLTQPTEPGVEITCADGIDNDCDALPDLADPNCNCRPVDTPLHEIPITPKNRFLSFVGATPGHPTAIRVTLSELPVPFDAVNGISMWVAPPRPVSENSGVDDPTQLPDSPVSLMATLQCDPFYADWSTLGTVHVFHEFIVPSGVYHLQAIGNACAPDGETNYSSPLVVTTGAWGDLVADCVATPCSPPDGSVGVTTDVTAVLDKFRNSAGSPLKARSDLEPATPDLKINISDVTMALDAFEGFPYPFTPGPSPCTP